MGTISMKVVAEDLATQVAEAESAGRRRSWRKVTTLLAAFGVDRLTPAARASVGLALSEAGLVCEPALNAVNRADTVRLSRFSPPLLHGGQVDTTVENQALESTAVRVSSWLPGRPAQMTQNSGSGEPDGDAMMLIEVNPNAEPIDRLYGVLSQYCGNDLRIEMVEDLLQADALPKVTERSDWSARVVSTFGVDASDDGRDVNQNNTNGASKAGPIVFQPVEFIVGAQWLVMCWHNTVRIQPDEARTDRVVQDGNPILRETVMARVRRGWEAGTLNSAGDLALSVSLELARMYESAQSELAAWMDQWESALDDNEPNPETKTLGSVRRAVQEYRSRIQGLEIARLSSADQRWLPGLSNLANEDEFRGLLRQTSRGLDTVAKSVSSAMELVMMKRMAEQLTLSHRAQEAAARADAAVQEEHERTAHFQNTLTVLGAILFGPSLVAAIYGANVDLPGRDQRLGTLILVAGMVGISLISLIWVSRLQQRAPSTTQGT